MLTLAILYGGKSGEHEVSLRSAASIVTHLYGRYHLHLIGISKTGTFYLQPDSYPEQVVKKNISVLQIEEDLDQRVLCVPNHGFVCRDASLSVDIVFPVLHGTFGEDGTIQGLLETLDLPYVGAGVLASSVGMDKEVTKRIWLQAGLPIVPFQVVTTSSWKAQKDKVYEYAQALGYPVFVKPACIGSSVGISKVKRPEELLPACAKAFLYDSKILLEKGISAREIECSVVGNDKPVAFTAGEVVPSHEFYDYEAKYLDPQGAELRIPAPISPKKMNEVKELALQAFQTLGVEGFARIDFFLEKTNEALYLNEINTIPGFTSISMFPRMCAFDGLEYPALLDRLIQLGLERYKRRKALCYDYTAHQ
ncbi:MAG: D-alanine--D-alanine ligase family protein [Spirochaetales bacterium]